MGVSFAAGFFINDGARSARHEERTACQQKYPFTSQMLDCTVYDMSVASTKALDAKLNDATAEYVKEGKAKRVSVWVRDLNTGQWAASNEFDTYAPASLLKLPLMIAYYKFAEIQPSILDEELTYQPAATLDDSAQDILPGAMLVTGQKYTVERLIEQMIEQSDNNAADILVRKIDPQFLDSVLVELGIRIPKQEQEIDFITAKSYANVFRMLYNASYLNRDFSEKALDILSKTSFKGIADPLPQDTKVAHKFGERELDDGNGNAQRRELHDCGIVYKADGPYSLCIFTEGTDFDKLTAIIKDLSKIAYDSM